MIALIFIIGFILFVVIGCILEYRSDKKEYESMKRGDVYHPYKQLNPFKRNKAVILDKKDGFVLFSYNGKEYSVEYNTFFRHFGEGD